MEKEEGESHTACEPGSHVGSRRGPRGPRRCGRGTRATRGIPAHNAIVRTNYGDKGSIGREREAGEERAHLEVKQFQLEVQGDAPYLGRSREVDVAAVVDKVPQHHADPDSGTCPDASADVLRTEIGDVAGATAEMALMPKPDTTWLV